MTNFCEDIDNDIIQNTINNHILAMDQNDIQCVLLDEVSNDFMGVWYVTYSLFINLSTQRTTKNAKNTFK